MTEQSTRSELDAIVKLSPKKWVYLFSEGNATLRELIGGKGPGVGEMTNAGKGVLTARGGATSHAAVVARGLGLPCVAGTEGIRVSEEEHLFQVVICEEQGGDPESIEFCNSIGLTT
ncbi:MAG: hypothetical protein PVS3B3_05310 [Ktedonobacteraceae bacterium]